LSSREKKKNNDETTKENRKQNAALPTRTVHYNHLSLISLIEYYQGQDLDAMDALLSAVDEEWNQQHDREMLIREKDNNLFGEV
jgi:hypothetical protein